MAGQEGLDFLRGSQRSQVLGLQASNILASPISICDCFNAAMYWPLGAPRVYAASRRRRKDLPGSKEADEDGDSEEKAASAILGLRVSRNGHLFVTITKTALTIWQTSVRRIAARTG